MNVVSEKLFNDPLFWVVGASAVALWWYKSRVRESRQTVANRTEEQSKTRTKRVMQFGVIFIFVTDLVVQIFFPKVGAHPAFWPACVCGFLFFFLVVPLW